MAKMQLKPQRDSHGRGRAPNNYLRFIRARPPLPANKIW